MIPKAQLTSDEEFHPPNAASTLSHQNTFSGKRPIKTENVEKCFSKNQKTENETFYFEYPYMAIGVVREKIDDVIYQSTGVLISSNIVLTSYKKANIENLSFGPCINAKGSKFFAVKEIQSDKQKKYSLFVMEENLGEEYGYVGIDFSDHSIKKGDKLEICGYLAENEDHYPLLRESGLCEGVDEENFTYNMKTFMGQEGSPLLKRDSNNIWLVGIHQKKKALGKKSTGTRVIKQNIQEIKFFLEK